MHKVLVPLAIIKLKEGTIAPAHFARETYIKKMAKYHLLPLFVSGAMPREMIDELYDLADGVLCMGGSDVNPTHYGEAAHPKTESNEPLRDELEIYVLQRATKDKKPVLGICRGLQSLAVATGGTLYQHVPDIAPDEKHTAEAYEDLIIPEKKHKVKVLPDTALYRLLNRDSILTNTAHHQSVKDAGPLLRVSAITSSGIIEAAEAKDSKYFCLGVQSHPEAEEGDLEPIFQAFANALDDDNS